MRRQRYRCRPSPGERAHVYTDVLPRLLGSGQACDDCERLVPRHEGPTTPRRFRFATRLVADALLDLGRGASYRATAERVRRRAAGGPHPWAVGRQPNLVADWVELFAPLVAPAPAADYRTLVLDELPFWVAARGERARPSYAVFGILGHLGHERPELSLRAASGHSRAEWERVLRELNCAPPERVVCDETKGVVAAVRAVWPAPRTPRIWYCHHHLGRGLENLVGDRLELRVALASAFGGPAAWAHFCELARSTGDPRLVRWLDRLEPVVGSQVATPLEPRSTGALEERLRVVRAMLADRRGRFTNRARLDRLLVLIADQLNGRADRATYASRIREFLTGNGGCSGPRHLILDPAGQPSLW